MARPEHSPGAQIKFLCGPRGPGPATARLPPHAPQRAVRVAAGHVHSAPGAEGGCRAHGHTGSWRCCCQHGRASNQRPVLLLPTVRKTPSSTKPITSLSSLPAETQTLFSQKAQTTANLRGTWFRSFPNTVLTASHPPSSAGPAKGSCVFLNSNTCIYQYV